MLCLISLGLMWFVSKYKKTTQAAEESLMLLPNGSSAPVLISQRTRKNPFGVYLWPVAALAVCAASGISCMSIGYSFINKLSGSSVSCGSEVGMAVAVSLVGFAFFILIGEVAAECDIVTFNCSCSNYNTKPLC